MFHAIFYQPILNLLVFLYNSIPGHDVGLAIIAVTIVVRLILYPTFSSSIKSQKALQEIQPEVDALREKHKDDKAEQTKAMLQLYQEKKINPYSSCLPLLIQLPFIFALYRVLNNQLQKSSIDGLYSFIHNPGSLNPIAFGGLNLADPKNVPLAILAAVLQFAQAAYMQRQTHPKSKVDPTMKIMQTQMLYVLPIITFFVALKLPAGLPLYWSVTTLFAIAQQWFIMSSRRKEAKQS
jgi:YidC/Oxa1 family membrane protein insertase